MRLALLLLALVGCETPNAKIVYVISDGVSQGCGSSSCADIKIPCDAVISVRILRPSDTPAPLVTICEALPKNKNRDLCAISSVDLSDRPVELPVETLEVQMLIWAHQDVEVEGKPEELDCAKNEVKFDAVGGFPIAQAPSPAIGGHTYYHPGDEEIRIELGCTDLPSLNKCDPMRVEYTATVENFESIGVLVSREQGFELTVDIGEPKLRGTDSVYSLVIEDLERMVMDTVVVFTPFWHAIFEPTYVEKTCVQVLEDAAQATASVRCTDENVPPQTMAVSLSGVHVPKSSLDQILAALSLAQFPANGLVIGVVVDSVSNPVAGATVIANNATIRYLSADRTNANGTSTSTNGIFISQDADFGTARFSVAGSQQQVGGLIQGKLTVVVIKKP